MKQIMADSTVESNKFPCHASLWCHVLDSVQHLATTVRYMSKEKADISRLDDSSYVFINSDGWQFSRLADSSQKQWLTVLKTWWQQSDECQHWWLTFQDLVTAVMCLSTAMANSSRLGDSSMMFHKSNCRQLLTELLQNDDGLHATLVLKPAHSRTSVETSRST